MPPSVPHLDVNWYASGGIFNKPSVIGVGEAGTEAVIPIDKLDDIMAKAIGKLEGSGLNKNKSINITINNPVAEKSSESARRQLTRLSYMGVV